MTRHPALFLTTLLACTPSADETTSSATTTATEPAGTSTDPSAPTTGTTTVDATSTTTTTTGSTSTADPTSDPTLDPTTTSDPDTTDTDTTTGAPVCGETAPLWDDGLVPSNTLHIDPAGADAADCGAADSPCKTIAGAFGTLTPGTEIVLHPGTYAADQFLEIQGSDGAPVWIGGAEGEEVPVIDGGSEGMHLVRPRYVILHDLEIKNATSNGLNIDDAGEYDNPEAARYVGVRNVTIHDIGQGGNEDCLKLSGVNDYFVVDSQFSACGGGGQGSGIDHVGCHHGVVARNDFSNISGNAVQCKGGSADIEIRHNLLTETGERGVNLGGSTGFEFFRPPLVKPGPNAEATDIRVVANVIVGGEAAVAFVGCVDCLVADNTIVRPHNWLLRILQETTDNDGYTFLPAGGGTFKNNIVVFDRADLSTYVNIGTGTDAPSFTFANNLWFAADDPAQSDPAGDLPAPETAGIVGQDPLLVDLDGGVYIPTADSPAVQAGLAPAATPRDIAGICFADPPTLGAFELVP